MKVSAAVLPFLILAAALGPLAHGFPNYGYWDYGSYQPTVCCFSYTPRNIRCGRMEHYYQTSSFCPLPAVVFTNKWGEEACFYPYSPRVQECMMTLDSDGMPGTGSDEWDEY